MSGQFEYPEDPHEPDDPEYGQRHGLVGALVLRVLRRLGQVHGGVLLLGDDRGQRDEVRYDGDYVDRVHHVLEEVQLVGTGQEPDGQLEREPHDADGLDEEERVRDVRHLVLLDLRAVRRRVEHLVVLELRQRFQAEYHNGQQYDEHGYYGHHPGGLRALRVLEQQPHLPLELGFWQWFFFFFYETLFFPAEKEKRKLQGPHCNETRSLALKSSTADIILFFFSFALALLATGFWSATLVPDLPPLVLIFRIPTHTHRQPSYRSQLYPTIYFFGLPLPFFPSTALTAY